MLQKKDLKKNHILTIDDLNFKSPGGGLEPYRFTEIIGKKIITDLNEDDLILIDHVQQK